MNIVNLTKKPYAPVSHASIEPLCSLPDTLSMREDGRYYAPLKPNNKAANEPARFGDTVAVLRSDILKYYDIA